MHKPQQQQKTKHITQNNHENRSVQQISPHLKTKYRKQKQKQFQTQTAFTEHIHKTVQKNVHHYVMRSTRQKNS